MLRRIFEDFCQLHRALKRYYLKRAHPPLTPEQEVERVMRQMRQREELARRFTWRP